MEKPLNLKLIRFLDLLMKVNVVLCIIGIIAIKSGFFERSSYEKTAESASLNVRENTSISTAE
jgi:hypothetical protein